jgi:hypothetical protein
MSWKEAYIKQAKSDFMIYKEFSKTRKPICQQLHYLQMATEKLAKSYLCSLQNGHPKITHFALVKFLKICKRQPDIRAKLGFENKHTRFSSYIDSLLPIADMIEQLAPVGTKLDRPNPEYPWISNKEVIPPIDYDFSNFKDKHIQMSKFLKFIHKLIDVS